MDIFEKAKKAVTNVANKISDEINRGSYDKSCLNTALLTDAEITEKEKELQELKDRAEKQRTLSPVVKIAPTIEPIFNNRPQLKEAYAVVGGDQIKGSAPSVTEGKETVQRVIRAEDVKDINDGGIIRVEECNNIDAKSVIKSAFVSENKEEAPKKEEEKQTEIVEEKQEKQEKEEKPVGGFLRGETRVIIKEEDKENTSKEVPDKQTDKTEDNKAKDSSDFAICYYVTLIDDKVFPKVGSRRTMRLCDNSFIWDDSMGEDVKPKYDVCPICKKPTSFIETHLEQ